MNEKGFTLVELLVVVSVLMVILGFGVARYTAFNRRERVKQAAFTLKATLRFAQTKAISAEKPSSGCTTYLGMRVSFTATSYSTQHECSPEGLTGPVTSVAIPTTITFLPVPASFIFLTRTNTVDIADTVTLTLTNGTETYQLSVTPSGSVNDLGFQ